MPHLGCCSVASRGVNPLSLAPFSSSPCPNYRTHYCSLCTHHVFSTLLASTPIVSLRGTHCYPLLDRCMTETWKSRCPAQSHTAGRAPNVSLPSLLSFCWFPVPSGLGILVGRELHPGLKVSRWITGPEACPLGFLSPFPTTVAFTKLQMSELNP